MSAHGLHHVTAYSGPAQRNLDFYRRVLGLRLVKKTVNFDDPGTYHLYYGDEAGNPGTILTFFPIEQAARGRLGTGETQETAFTVPRASIAAWMDRFASHGVAFETPVQRFGETVVRFTDPDGMSLALVGIDGLGETTSSEAIRGFHGVTLRLTEACPTAAILTDVLGFTERAREGAFVRLGSDAKLGGLVTIEAVGEAERGRPGAGTVHHIAFRAADDAEQEAMAARLRERHGLSVTEQRDRNYFRSVYFREPGGVLFEIATDIPGFAFDEPADALGEALKLPSGLEAHRARIEAVLPRLD
ncbi:MAG: ring-cleaving dioxygenase [Methylobacterium sp.]|uniref:ring-cleaving dioxygenase n=1 Tax=Methylobacterium sp. TaxID=409 RepID=UPI0025EABA00|nr:ring-cleaving dioxygenase [Methylobacterium sp.]MBX9929966.1 ring-cleaving dioxygenase [Methylobacterium sp.]